MLISTKHKAEADGNVMQVFGHEPKYWTNSKFNSSNSCLDISHKTTNINHIVVLEEKFEDHQSYYNSSPESVGSSPGDHESQTHC